ncbi:NAD-dependent epimerase/dehydratase family protein [Desertifilum sp. FACHB-1129]|uniref:NAD-dependent epimerase/dehydratase domain-containing protein n=2 Tax=Desertifilum tharense IPPAS B-1220 TaxID=1781255 RepID=A0A1E5QCZ6_9CYAN|nr:MULTISPECIES: NAD-dependent epimerase/dehydratase family protein [Desertifilum]MDA0208779.1 NAD-dependent epimerase/dehydratase family protein [Cyanobacteria bacterium FC1]MBD2310981.1 NAD-dependent epimerase/dehydratase family protein [Desertifilum sp. FACHB-1129]MBD2321386.1 NAD-dependent epimerase/dehydratase family protein [Desertifilum sp. FACHB-866]MBD2331307.1 NAD-dependent epimerase/dehydratase family protein [Desertifilum sp. FACHB-868]OEJ72464.1 hypothetical protein BH720_24855 [D
MLSWETEFGNAFRGKRVLITGASGFIGGHLADALVALEAQTYGLSRQGKVSHPSIIPLSVDLSDWESVKVTLAKVQPQIIFHLASYVTASQNSSLVLPMLQNNLVATVNVLLGALETGCDRLVTVGSSEELATATSAVPSSPYAVSKASASLYAQTFHLIYDLPSVIVRPFLSYGPRQGVAKLIPYTILALLKGENPQISSGSRVCDFIFILDVVRGMLKAGVQPAIEGKALDLGTGQGTSVKTLVELLSKQTGSSANPTFTTIAERKGEQPQIADLETTRKLLNWEPLWSLTEGLTTTINWYKTCLEAQ